MIAYFSTGCVSAYYFILEGDVTHTEHNMQE